MGGWTVAECVPNSFSSSDVHYSFGPHSIYKGSYCSEFTQNESQYLISLKETKHGTASTSFLKFSYDWKDVTNTHVKDAATFELTDFPFSRAWNDELDPFWRLRVRIATYDSRKRPLNETRGSVSLWVKYFQSFKLTPNKAISSQSKKRFGFLERDVIEDPIH